MRKIDDFMKKYFPLYNYKLKEDNKSFNEYLIITVGDRETGLTLSWHDLDYQPIFKFGGIEIEEVECEYGHKHTIETNKYVIDRDADSLTDDDKDKQLKELKDLIYENILYLICQINDNKS